MSGSGESGMEMFQSFFPGISGSKYWTIFKTLIYFLFISFSSKVYSSSSTVACNNLLEKKLQKNCSSSTYYHGPTIRLSNNLKIQCKMFLSKCLFPWMLKCLFDVCAVQVWNTKIHPVNKSPAPLHTAVAPLPYPAANPSRGSAAHPPTPTAIVDCPTKHSAPLTATSPSALLLSPRAPCSFPRCPRPKRTCPFNFAAPTTLGDPVTEEPLPSPCPFLAGNRVAVVD